MELQLFQADVTNVTQHVTSRVRDVTEDCTTPLGWWELLEDAGLRPFWTGIPET